MMTKILSIGVRDRSSRKEMEYKNKVALENPSLLALVFEDLIHGYNAPIEKAIEIYKKKYHKEKVFPI